MSEIDLQECRDVAWAHKHAGKYKAAAKRLEMLCDEIEQLREERDQAYEKAAQHLEQVAKGDKACGMELSARAMLAAADEVRALKDTEEADA